MARRERPRDHDPLVGQARLVEVRVIGEPGDHGDAQGSNATRIVRPTVAAVLVAALLAIVLTTVVGSNHRRASAKPAPTRSAPARRAPVLAFPARPTAPDPALTRSLHTSPAAARESERADVAAVYGDPLGCLRVTIAPTDPSYARVEYNRVSTCSRNDGTITAIYHRVDGDWRPVLDARGYACPIASRSRALASELRLCP